MHEEHDGTSGVSRLEAMGRRMQRWRSRYGGPGRRIPEGLWNEAVAIARVEGVRETARALHLDARKLERRLVGASVHEGDEGVAPTAFVELTASELAMSAHTAIELLGSDGERMRIEVAGAFDVAALLRSLWRRSR